MARGSSKRSRKARDRFSLKVKGQAVPGDVVSDLNLLSEDIRDGGMKDQLLVNSKKQKVGADSQQTLLNDGRPVSKSEMRKVKQIERRKAAQAKLQSALESIESAKLDAAAQKMMIPSSLRGGTLTAKQRLKREKAMHDSGLTLSDDSMLFKQRGGAESGHEMKPSVREKSHLPGKGEAASVSGSDTEYSMDEKPTGPAVNSEVPVDLPCRAPPISVTFGKRKKVEQAQNLPGSSRQVLREGDEVACLATAPVSMQLNEQQQQAVSEARAKLVAAGEMKNDDQKDPPAHPPRSVPSLGLTRHRSLHRRPEIESARSELPIIAMEQEIMAMVDEHDVLLLCGATGCGKTTQVPQFLLEAGFGCKDFPERAGMVGVTQPRRVAAVSTARRVGDEVGDSSNKASLIGYQVRYDRDMGSEAAVKFMTDGILMRELQDDFLLTKCDRRVPPELQYSVIVIDEAHERSLNTDLLIGMLSRIVPQRRAMYAAGSPSGPAGTHVQPLKLIIMSATMRVQDFAENKRLFPQHLYAAGPPPVINVPARQFPVVVHFSKRTETEDYISAACRKVSRIHKELPPGGILVFVTGQSEVHQMVTRIKALFPSPLQAKNPLKEQDQSNGVDQGCQGAQDGGFSVIEAAGADRAEADATLGEALEEGDFDEEEFCDFEDSDADEDQEETVQLGSSNMSPEDIDAAEKYFEQKYSLSNAATKPSGLTATNAMTSQKQQKNEADSDDENLHEGVGVRARNQAEASQKNPQRAPVFVLPLYAMLPPEEQSRVFEDPPEGHRLIIVATNVAETSLTIPGIRYVVDTGRSKQKLLEESHVHRYQVRWISQASADQRAGRAGRTGPGHCYRLFSAAVFNDMFPKFTAPEIQNMQLDGVVLSMHGLCLPKILHFPYPTPPDSDALRSAEKSLVAISALTPKNALLSQQTSTGADLKLTAVGEEMVGYPLPPRHSRLILAAAELLQQGRFKDKKLLVYAIGLAAAMSMETPFLASASSPTGPQTHSASDASEKKESEKLQNGLHAAHLRFRHRKSDALSALNVLVAYESQDPSEAHAFCKRNFLHATTLREMSALRKQLAVAITRSSARGLQKSSKRPLTSFMSEMISQCGSVVKPPGGTFTEALLHCIAKGWADQTAKRMRSVGSLQTLASQGKGNRAIRYSNCSTGAELYMHPKSNLHKAAPEYVVYAGLTRTDKRTYMNTLSTIEPSWVIDSSSVYMNARKT